MAKKDRDTLKTYFQDGDRPIQGEFINLIDSSLDLAASGQSPLQSTASLQAGTGITLAQTGSTIQIAATSGSGLTLAASLQPGLTTTASLQAGTGISITQTGSVIAIVNSAAFSLAASLQTALTSVASLQTAPCGFIAMTQTGSIIKLDTTASNARYIIERQVFG